MTTQESFNRLAENVRMMAHRKRARHTRMIIIQAIILVFVIVYLSWAHSMIAKVQADDIVRNMQERLTDQLPELSNKLADKLNSYAPELMAKARDKALSYVPVISKQVDVELDTAMEKVREMMKQEMSKAEAIIKGEKAKLDLQTPKLPDKESIDQLLKLVREKLKENITKSSVPIVDDYNKVLKDIDTQLEHLTLDDKALNDKEVLQKRIIEIWLKLIRMKSAELLK